MSSIPLLRLRKLEDAPGPLLERVERMQAAIRQMAEELVQARGGSPGCALDDWFRAERRVCWAPQAQLLETDTAIHLLMGVPGMDSADLEIAMFPEAVIVLGSGLAAQDTPGRVHFSDFGTGRLFRRIDFPAPVHVDSAVVSLENSLLMLSAAKVETVEAGISSVVGAA